MIKVTPKIKKNYEKYHDIVTHQKFVVKLLKTTVFSKKCLWEKKKKCKDKCVTVKVKEKLETKFLKGLFSHNACFFILVVIYNSIYEKLILEFTSIKVIYRTRILKVILKVMTSQMANLFQYFQK